MAQNPTASDSLRAAIKYGRQLEVDLAIAKGDVRIAKDDSVRTAALHQIEIKGKDQEIAWLEDQLPRFYEKPVFVGLTVMVVTIWAVLRAVHISI